MFVPTVCSPRCVNGGTCENGVCNCIKGFSGDLCETRGKVVLKQGLYTFGNHFKIDGNKNLIDVKFASGIKNIQFGF